MPKKIQLQLKEVIARPPRFHKGAYEKRAVINGVALYSCSKSREICEANFLEELTKKWNSIVNGERTPKIPSDILFRAWGDQWMQEVFRPDVSEITYKNELSRYNGHVLPYFGDRNLKDISPLDCVKFFNRPSMKEHERTAESCYGLLNRIFQFAVVNRIILSNPMSAVKPIKHERENGVPLSRDEEAAFLKAIIGRKHELVWILMLYTGLRPCELPTARIEEEFIVAQNMKQKTGKVVFKKIPVTPMLRPYLPRLSDAMPNWKELSGNPRQINKMFKEIAPDHTLYDLRTTFATRAQECGVPEQVVQVWMGHVPGTLLGKVYTKFSDEYLLSEGKKVKY